jgi:hypothetical protein
MSGRNHSQKPSFTKLILTYNTCTSVAASLINKVLPKVAASKLRKAAVHPEVGLGGI